MYNIMIVGVGYVGTEVGKYFVHKKQRVFGLVKSDASARRLESEGINPILVDLLNPQSIPKIPSAHFIVISLAPDERTDEAYERVYVEAVKNYLVAIENNPKPFLIVYISSTRVWEQSSPEWIDESVLTQPVSNQAQILLLAERQILTSNYPSLVLRLSGIYGPERNRIERFRKREFRKPGPDKYLNFIHRDDAVGAIAALFKSGEAGEVYTGVDDEPTLESNLYEWISGNMNVPFSKELFTQGDLGGKRLLNNKLKSTGYEFKYPTFRDGYKSLMGESDD